MLIRVEIDGVTRHYCADCATESTACGVSVADEGHWVGRGVCCQCGLVARAEVRRVEPTRSQAGPVLPPLPAGTGAAAAEARLLAAVNGTGDEEETK